MFYIIYKITNLLDGKIYLGKHQTKNPDDGYMGSGKILGHAKKKHGIENFTKEILFQFDHEEEMNLKEKELVTEEFCAREDTYNLCPGGKGGWGYLNSPDGLQLETRQDSICAWNENGRKVHLELLKNDTFYRERHMENLVIASSAAKKLYERGVGYWNGKSHSVESKEKMSKMKVGHNFQSGNKNSQFGTMWITDGAENRKIKKDDPIPDGWYRGYRPKIKSKNVLID